MVRRVLGEEMPGLNRHDEGLCVPGTLDGVSLEASELLGTKPGFREEKGCGGPLVGRHGILTVSC